MKKDIKKKRKSSILHKMIREDQLAHGGGERYRRHPKDTARTARKPRAQTKKNEKTKTLATFAGKAPTPSSPGQKTLMRIYGERPRSTIGKAPVKKGT